MTRRFFIPVLAAAAQARPRARDLYYESPEADKSPLGLRYSLFREAAGKWNEVPWGTILRTGDQVRVLFESNTEGSLFLLARGENGKWEPAAPNLPVNIAPDRPYTLPPNGLWVLDPPAGEDILFLVFGRKGDLSLETLIEESRGGDPTQLIAEAKVKSRDLILDLDPPPSARNETARYAVNPGAEKDAKVAMEIRIRHR